MRVVSQGRRSTLWVTDDGAVRRQYHDTGRWSDPLTVRIDDRGACRGPGNRTLSSMLRDPPSSDFRGAHERPAPTYLRNALRCLVREPADATDFARMCGVAPATGWCYACQVVERWPAAASLARKFVYPPLLQIVDDTPDRSGSLRELMERLEQGPLRGDVEWRCVRDRHAHLRLARLCAHDDAVRAEPPAQDRGSIHDESARLQSSSLVEASSTATRFSSS